MHMLQYREKSRAWRTMEMRDDTDTPRPIHERLRAAITGPYDPAADRAELMARARRIRHRLADRMDGLLSDEALERRLGLVSPETLKVFVETDPWITGEVGGEEVDVSAFYPQRSAQPTTGNAGRPEHQVA